MIKLKDFKTGYGDKIVARIEEMEFKRGEITAILGCNGSGKSTIIKALAGIIPHEGELTLQGTGAHELSHKQRAARISYLPQNTRMPDIDVLTLVSHGRFPHLGFVKTLSEEDRKRIEHAMEITDTLSLKYRNLKELSGGERQRAYIAMIVAQDTDMLLLDEPTTYMDIAHQIEVMNIIRKLAGSGKGIVLTSHDLPQSFTYSDKICLLHRGRIMAAGSPGEIASDKGMLREAMNVSVARLTEIGQMAEAEHIYDYVLTKGGV